MPLGNPQNDNSTQGLCAFRARKNYEHPCVHLYDGQIGSHQFVTDPKSSCGINSPCRFMNPIKPRVAYDQPGLHFDYAKVSRAQQQGVNSENAPIRRICNLSSRNYNILDETEGGEEQTAPPSDIVSSSASSVLGSEFILREYDKTYIGPSTTPPQTKMRLYDSGGPVCFHKSPSFNGERHRQAELRRWEFPEEIIISQNSSKRKVYRGIWLSPLAPSISFPVAIKFVEDGNHRDGRSVRREIECHTFIYEHLSLIHKEQKYRKWEDAWPCAELFGYHLDKKNPGKSVLITRKLSGPDFFDVIRKEHGGNIRLNLNSEFHKLHWCMLALIRVDQYRMLGIRHNDIKPDNIVLDQFETEDGKKTLDVKIIDLGTASREHAKEFTGGTSWYESPEQKQLEYYAKKEKNPKMAETVDIGLASDIWAAGLSITEVLVGRRVVDCLKAPQGPGPLEFRGEKKWAVEPKDWVKLVEKALLSAPREGSKYTFCFDAARCIFEKLVRPNADERRPLSEGIAQLQNFCQEAARKSKKTIISSRSSCQ